MADEGRLLRDKFDVITRDIFLYKLALLTGFDNNILIFTQVSIDVVGR